MQNKEIYNQFKALTSNNSENASSYLVLPILNTQHKLGCSKEGYPKFFIFTSGEDLQTNNTILNILTVEYNLSCTFVNDYNIPVINNYSVLTLKSADSNLQEIFIDLVIMMFSRLSENPSRRDIAIEVENLISIFSALVCPPRKKIQGLWTELLVIERSSNPETLTHAWHESPIAKYDFTMGRDKIEVKSTCNENRNHHFSLDQLCPSTHSNVVIASSIVRESGPGNGGLSVNDLIGRVFNKGLSVDAKIHILKVVTETIGKDIYLINKIYFDYIEASDTLRFYDATKIPAIDKSGIHNGVTSVGFNSNLSGIDDIKSPNSDFKIKGSPLYNCLFH